jgi:16S rRNA (cytosine1402-N4)-methyltransferase
MIYHQPVLLDEVIRLFNPKKDKIYLDATLGHGGHTIPLLESGATVFGLDTDNDSLALATKRITALNLATFFHPLKGNFSRLKSIWKKHVNQPLDGLLFDLGLNTSQQLSPNRGFSFNDPHSLDMRLDPIHQPVTAENIINTTSEADLFNIFSKISQEKYSRPLSQRIIKCRQQQPIKSGIRLAEIIRYFYKEKKVTCSHDPATKIFLALRITVNNELKNLSKALEASLDIVKPQGRVIIITFHSGEDRLVKNFLRNSGLKSQKLSPSRHEVSINPLSRSAHLRSYTIN